MHHCFPAAIKKGKDDIHGEYFINGEHYCIPYIASIYACIRIANLLKINCLFNKQVHIFFKYRFGIENFGKIGSNKNHIYNEIFSIFLPNDNIIPQITFEEENKCKTCMHEIKCQSEYNSFKSTLHSLLKIRDYDEIEQAKKVIEKIIKRKDEIRDDKDIVDVINQFTETKEKINRNIHKFFPKIRRWANMTTILSTPIAITSTILSATQSSNAIIPIISGATTAISGGITQGIEYYTEKNKWIGFFNKNE